MVNLLVGNSSEAMTKYNCLTEYGNVDNKLSLELANDAARVNWGGSWRMPTHKEFYELSQLPNEWTTQEGIYGRKFTATNGNSIFLPAAGEIDNTTTNQVQSRGSYWTSTLHTSWCNEGLAWQFSSYGIGARFHSISYRNQGYTIRAVQDY